MSELSKLEIDPTIFLQDALRGNRSSAYELIHYLNKHLKENPSAIPQPILDWLADGIMDIAFNKVSGKKALGAHRQGQAR